MGSNIHGRRLAILSLQWHNRYSQLSRSLPSPPPSLPNNNHSTHHKPTNNTHLTREKVTIFMPPNTLFNSHPHLFHTFATFPSKPISHLRNISASAGDNEESEQSPDGMDEEVEPIDLWEEEDDTEPEIGDGADGGGIALHNCPWGEHALSIARKVLLEFDDDLQLYAFKTTPRGYIYVRLDKLSHEYGCPSMEEIESYSRQYKKRLDEVGASGEIPDDLALEVSSPSAERLLRVPDDLHRFKYMPMRVSYVDDVEGKCQEKNGVFLLDLVNLDSGTCTWRLASVKVNRDPLAKGRPLSRKQRDWRLELPFSMSKRVTLYLDY